MFALKSSPVTPEPPPSSARLPLVGMTCMSCAQTIERLLREIPGVHRVHVNLAGEEAHISYDPDTIVVRKGRPVRLNFTRQESALCSETVVFDKIGRSAKLPEGEVVSIEFTPDDTGDIPFQCQMGMLRGKVVVTE